MSENLLSEKPADTVHKPVATKQMTDGEGCLCLIRVLFLNLLYHVEYITQNWAKLDEFGSFVGLNNPCKRICIINVL